MSRSVSGRLMIALLVFTLLLIPIISASAKPSGTVDVQILAVNDFHGNLQPPSGSS